MSSAEELGRLLRERGLTLAVAESCTGGKLSDEITSVPGSSDYFLGGVVSYGNAAKVSLLGVSEDALRDHGAVSQQVAEQMAEGVRRSFGSDVGMSTTGIAGPGGGSESKPVGLVYIAASVRGARRCREHLFPGSRDSVKKATVDAALDLVMELLAKAD